jgi:hypothetical protein
MTKNVQALLTANAPKLVWMLLTDEQQLKTIRSFADRFKSGERWPAIIVDGRDELLDGAHRLCAAYLLGMETIETN